MCEAASFAEILCRFPCYKGNLGFSHAPGKAARVGAEYAGELSPGVGGAHVDDPNSFDPRLGRLNTK